MDNSNVNANNKQIAARFWLLFVLMLVQANGRAGTTELRTMQELAAVLKWEVLWGQIPSGFEIPTNGRVHVAIRSQAGSVSYCSHDLRVCESYRTYDFRNWKEVRTSTCTDSASDEQLTILFTSDSATTPPNGQTRYELGTGGLSGGLMGHSGLVWSAYIQLPQLRQIVREYKRKHPEQIGSLKHWIQMTTPPSAGYNAITIACFASSDPIVHLYGERRVNGPILLSVFWDGEAREWRLAGMLEARQDPKRVEESRRTVESVACSKVLMR